jgi:hypothetical protein
MPTPRKLHSSLCFGLVFTQPKALTDMDTVTSSPGDTPWPTLTQLPTETAEAMHAVSASYVRTKHLLTLRRFQVPVPSGPIVPIVASPAELSWIFDPGQLPGAPVGYSPVDESGVGELAPHYGPHFSHFAGPAVKSVYVSFNLGPTFGES